MSGEGLLASASWVPPSDCAVPTLVRNPFYEDAARRVARMLPEYGLSAVILEQIDLALHEERQAARRAYDRKVDERRG